MESVSINQMHGEWWIYRTIDVKGEMTFYRYENGEKTGDRVWNTVVNVGSHTHNFPIFHCNANQRRSIIPSNQAFRVNYKYGTVKSIAENSNLELGTGLDCDGWNINGFGGAVVPQDKNRGVKVISDIDETPDLQWISNSQTIELTENDVIDVIFELITSHRTFSGLAPNILCYSFETDNFIMSGSGWVPKTGNETQRIVKNYGTKGQSITETFNLPRSPETSNLIIKVWIRQINVDFSWSQFYFNRIDVVPNTTNNIKGEFHTAQRTKRISSVTKNDKVVNNGDSISDIYYGTLYKETGEPTQLWSRHDEVTGKPLLRIMVEDILRIAPRPMYYFEGDLYGYYPYLSTIQINNVSGVYQVSKYSFDTVRNVNKNAFTEYATEYLTEGTDFTYKPTLDLGEVTKVSIVK